VTASDRPSDISPAIEAALARIAAELTEVKLVLGRVELLLQLINSALVAK
jgi:hypothetical protein